MTTNITERDILKRGLALLKRCFLPIALAVILSSVTGVIAAVIEEAGAEHALADAAHLHPGAKPDISDLETYFAYQQAVSEYTAAYDAAYAPYQWAARIVQLLNLLVAPLVLLGLNRGLLRVLDGGRCTPKDLLGGFYGGKRAILVAVLGALVQAGVLIVGVLLIALLGSFLYEVGAILGSIVAFVLSLWFTFRYALAGLHCADERSIDLSATDCLRYAHADQQQYGILGFVFTLWPVLAVSLAAELLGHFVSAPWVSMVSQLLGMAACAVELAVLAAIYDFLHSAQPADPALDEGRARAIALASQKDGE